MEKFVNENRVAHREHLRLREDLKILNLLVNTTVVFIVTAVLAIDIVRYLWF